MRTAPPAILYRPMDNAKQNPTQTWGATAYRVHLLFGPLRNSALQNIQIISSRRLPFILRFHFSKRRLPLPKTDSAIGRLELAEHPPQYSLDCPCPTYALDYTNPTILLIVPTQLLPSGNAVRRTHSRPDPSGARRTKMRKHLRSNGTLVRKHLRLSGTFTYL